MISKPKMASSSRKAQRLQDPIHGLIKFGETYEDQFVWKLIACEEFQRLRRIRQLGFSELVYPGATHTRFAHSVGVFNNSRRLIGIIRDRSGSLDERRGFAAKCAALLHDVGHGPFSHTFEGAEKQRFLNLTGTPKSKKAATKLRKHEEWTVEIITGDTSVNQHLREVDAEFPNEVAGIIRETESRDIYSSVVSSQFDADRLDYMKRDRYMTGIGSGDFDLEWLLDCLEVGEVLIGQTEPETAQSFVLNSKGYRAAEGYLQARFQLYSMVYMHKTTRAAEKMLGAVLTRVASLLADNGLKELGLSSSNPLVRHYRSKSHNLQGYLDLDDYSILAALVELRSAKDKLVSNLASSLLQRSLFKCLDLSKTFLSGSDQKLRFKKRLVEESKSMGLVLGTTLLEDDPEIEGYEEHGWEDETALNKVLIYDSEQKKNTVDIETESEIVKALEKKEKFYRIYVPDNERKTRIEKLVKEVIQ